MKSVELEVVESENWAGEYDDGTLVRTSNHKTHSFSANEGKIIYYTNNYNIFSSIDLKGNNVGHAIQIVKINNKSVKLKNVGEFRYKTLILQDNQLIKEISYDKLSKGFEVKPGQTIWFNTCSYDIELNYYIKVNKIELN